MSPNDEHFLKQLGIKPEEIVLASKPAPGYSAVFEPCPACSSRRHRNLNTGEVFCVSCAARKQREALMECQLAYAQRKAADVFNALPIFYRRFQVACLEGQGWRYRKPGEYAFEQWRKAESLKDAMEKINRLAQPENQEPDFERVENKCRGCNAPCGSRDWCRSCGRDKFGYQV